MRDSIRDSIQLPDFGTNLWDPNQYLTMARRMAWNRVSTLVFYLSWHQGDSARAVAQMFETDINALAADVQRRSGGTNSTWSRTHNFIKYAANAIREVDLITAEGQQAVLDAIGMSKVVPSYSRAEVMRLSMTSSPPKTRRPYRK